MANLARPAGSFNQKAANRWTARIIPIILIGIVGYVTYVVIVLVCVDYFLRSSTVHSRTRPRSAIAVIVLYSILLFAIAITYFRLLYTVITNPGYVPRGPQWYSLHEGRKRKGLGWNKGRPQEGGIREKTHPVGENNGSIVGSLGRFTQGDGSIASRPNALDEVSLDLQDFYGKDVFTCEGNGWPIWCSSCCCWKPDRAHHCREIGRCVRKMDHFCPWVGGVIGETTFKFFLQFIGWTAIYCMFTFVVTAIVISEQKKHSKAINAHWIVTISLAAMFGLFTLGMTGSSLQFVLLNSTTIENLSRHNKVWLLAIHMARPPNPPAAVGFSTISYPLADTSATQQTSGPTKTFAILHSKPGENPWDLGLLKNFKTVLGEHWYDWIIPIKHSPCCNHDRGDSQFPIGAAVSRICESAGIPPPHDFTPERSSKEQLETQQQPPRRHKKPKRSDPSSEPQSENERKRASKKKKKKHHHKTKHDDNDHHHPPDPSAETTTDSSH